MPNVKTTVYNKEFVIMVVNYSLITVFNSLDDITGITLYYKVLHC